MKMDPQAQGGSREAANNTQSQHGEAMVRTLNIIL